jgi:hypothetical protein
MPIIFVVVLRMSTALGYEFDQSQSINKVPTRFDVYIKGNRNDFFATRGADIAIVTGFGMDLLVIYY